MVSDHVFKFYGLSGFTSHPPSTPMAPENVTTSAGLATKFEIIAPEDLAPEDPDDILSEEEVSATEAPVSSPVFKIHPSSTLSSVRRRYSACSSQISV
ncbi:hypothetical protein FA13DRAFT_1735319 [Coprinellus micaceus]|uniref:Uncharacterized protein n=1 Tax=Coprinellus micaceus TaxID=71717 RepID=A0A4Y7T3T3_COPMI|nr:hypothetical protein FA13DRAFT_1735319 [Coprinellus micaceus]